MYGEYPFDNFDHVFKLNREITKERLGATKTPRKYAKYTIAATIILFIILLILGISLNLLALTVISIIIWIKFRIDIKKIEKPYYKKISENNINDFKDKQNYKEESYQSYIKKNINN